MKLFQKIFLGLLISVTFYSITSSQELPFPQGKDFAECIKPECVSRYLMNKQVENFYNFWKDKYLKEDHGDYYIESDGTGGSGSKKTVSEAHGWGMIIFALMAGYDDDAKKIFDGMYDFFTAHPSEMNNSLMQWGIKDGRDGEQYSATDGDMDIAYALILAAHQWDDEDYLEKAQTLIEDGIEADEINWETMRTMYGDYWSEGPESNKYLTRPSDWMGDHIEVYADHFGNDEWNDLADNFLDLYQSFTDDHASKTGLVTDFVINDPPEPCEENCLGEYKETDTYNFNSCRVPWRMAMHYAHADKDNKPEKAKEICNTMLDWLKSKDATNGSPANIKIGYELDGKPLDNSDDYSMAFVAPFISACVTDKDHQSFLDKGWYVICLEDEHRSVDSYENSIKLLNMLFISGNWWRPEEDIENTQMGEPEVDDSGVLLDDFENYYDDDPHQNFLGAAWGYAEANQQTEEGGGYWYTADDEKGSVINWKKDTVLNDNKKIKTLFTDSMLHVEINTKKSEATYPWAMIGCAILFEGEGDDYFDLSKMSGITIKAKGKGTVRVSLVTKDIEDLPDSIRWGYYGFDMELEDDWKTFVFPTAYFAPVNYSPAEDSGWGWPNHGMKEVSQLTFSPKEAKDKIKMYIDKIILNSLEYKKDFDFEPVPVPVNQVPQYGRINTGFSLLQYNGSENIRFSYTVNNNSNVFIGVFDVKGQMVFKPVNSFHKKGKYTGLIDLESQGFSSGTYFMQFSSGSSSITRRFNFIK